MLYKVYDNVAMTGFEVQLDELTAQITASILPEDMESEAIKAFAVIVRTELAKKIDLYGGSGCEHHKGYDICNQPGHCLQGAFKLEGVSQRFIDAVKETNNTIITFEGKPIKPFYHYRCGGATENSENVIGSRITYLRRVLCSYCREVNDESEKCYNISELESLLDTKISRSDNTHFSIRGMFEDIEADDQGRIKTIKIGNKLFKGTELMKILKLNSTRFNYSPIKFMFKTIGTGHGLGICQCGANEMAKRGKLWQDILKYYYTGVKLEEMQMPEEGRPLKGRSFVLDAGFGGANGGDGKGLNGLREKDVNLDIVLMLAELLRSEGAAVNLTRDSDVSVAMVDRASMANSAKPDFFISLLQNTFASPGVSGTEIYFFRGDKGSERLAGLIMEELVASLGIKSRGVRTAEYYLLREVKASSLIIQLQYITNPLDEARLADLQWRGKSAEAIFSSIKKYYAV